MLRKKFWFISLFGILAWLLPNNSQGVECSAFPAMPVLSSASRGYLYVYGAKIEIKSRADTIEGYEWIIAIEEAIELVKKANEPETFWLIFRPKKQNQLEIVIGKEPTEWYSGLFMWGEAKMFLNTEPCTNHPFDFEYLSENGFTPEEKLYIVLHELGHAYDAALDGLASEKLTENEFLQEKFFSKHAVWSGNYSHAEDFAESFAYFIFYPSYLKENRPLRFQLIKKILGVEYEDTLKIPSSVIAKLLEP